METILTRSFATSGRRVLPVAHDVTFARVLR